MTAAVIGAAVAGVAAVLGWLLALPRLRPPDGDPADLYRRLATWPYAALSGVLAAATVLLAAVAAPDWSWPVWTVTAAVTAPLAVLDGLTHRIPAHACHTGWILTPIAAIGSAAATGQWAGLVGFAAGGLGSAALFLVMWLLPRSNLGFGDVRYAPIIGATAGTLGLTGWIAALLAAAVLALIGFVLARAVRPRQSLLPWAPFLFAGLGVTVLIVVIAPPSPSLFGLGAFG